MKTGQRTRARSTWHSRHAAYNRPQITLRTEYGMSSSDARIFPGPCKFLKSSAMIAAAGGIAGSAVAHGAANAPETRPPDTANHARGLSGKGTLKERSKATDIL